MQVFWGDLHGHSRLSDGRRAPEEYYRYARDEARLDFCSLTDQIDHVPSSRLGRMSDESWNEIKEVTARFNQPGRFVTLLGLERSVPSWDGHTPGNICVYYRSDDGPLPRPGHTQRDWLRPGAINPRADMTQLWYTLKDVECIKAITHSSSARQGYTWPQAPPEYPVDLIEVYSKWGSAEAPAAPFPILDAVGHPPRHGGTAHDALFAGFKLGFIGSSGTFFGMPGSNIWENDWANAARYDKSGLTAVYAEELSREAIFEALKKRRCYAATYERMELSFSINDSPMGSVLVAPDRLRIHVRASGTRQIKRAEVFKNGEISYHRIGGREELEVYFDDNPPNIPTWYYVRVTQSGEDYAWSSPIWVMPELDDTLDGR